MQKPAEYVVVFQLPESFFASFDNMIAFEGKMIDSKPRRDALPFCANLK